MRKSNSSAFRRFFRSFDNRGNVAVVAALAMGPVCVAGLGAADLARVTTAKVELQDALDAAALAAARTTATTDAQLTTQGTRFLKQNLDLSSDFTLAASSFTFGPNGKVEGSAQLNVKPFIAGVVTGGTMAVSAQTEVVRADMKVEIALVLDNTGSMTEGTKLADLKKAASDFVTKMEDAAKKSTQTNPVKISLVPFSNSVRVDGTTYKTATWLDQNGTSPINDEIFTTATGTQHANRMTLFNTLGTAWRGCVEMRKAPYDVQDVTPNTGTPATLYTPFFAPDEPDSRTNGYSDNFQNNYLKDVTTSSNWRVHQGYVAKYKSTSGLDTTFGPNRGCGLQKLIRLTTDFSGLRSAIDNLNADGNTNIPIGMAWGWNTVSPNGPFQDGVAYGTPKYKKIVVLMTDGENTIAQRDTPNDGTYGGLGYVWQGRILRSNGTPIPQGSDAATRTAALDYRLQLLCNNMKAKDIEIYTIRVEVSTGTSDLLKNCATSDEYFYNVSNSTTLTAVFSSIAGQIAALHLSR